MKKSKLHFQVVAICFLIIMLVGTTKMLSKRNQTNSLMDVTSSGVSVVPNHQAIFFVGGNMEEKRCAKCKKKKTFDNFGKDKKHKDGLYSMCRECVSEYDSKYYSKNKEKIRKRHNKYYSKNKEKIINHNIKQQAEINFGGNRNKALQRDDYTCQNCGTEKKLVVHHIDGKGMNVSLKEKNHKLNNLLTLCKSCHSKLHNKGKNNSACKLKEEEVKEIKGLYLTGKFTFKELGKQFNVTFANISKIVTGKIWKHI